MKTLTAVRRLLGRRLSGATLLASALALGGWAVAARAADASKRSYDLAADEAVVSLRNFSRQSGDQVIFPEDPISGVVTRTVKGDYTAGEAIALMLDGTGLDATYDERSGAFAVNRKAPKADPPRNHASRPAQDQI